MNILVTYYSRTGTTKKVALALAKKMGADIDEIQDKKKKGFFGVLRACVQARKEKSSDITYLKKPKQYDLVIIGGPVWAWNLLPQLRKYLEENKDHIKKLGFFLTHGGNYGKNFEQVLALKKPLATMNLIDKEVHRGNYKKELNQFITKLMA